ncbi:adenylyl-sulfate kinase [Brumimicrobium salinarum]|uniref:Adenylyl-sulfate kinase n=1 Tax=Brumimicrobium salinarum TaxID=2058658 RepID=A0A2I0R4D3_9FLAO|nr:adenylyl-sulfate kinase [Brumimicrobium salinarum]PKR81417.1 adenylyl-sulfate kinase [Brumimicrobium salinarum]
MNSSKPSKTSKDKLNKRPVVWMTGLSGAGKTAIANALAEKLKRKQIPVTVLDGDVIRTGLSKDLTFSNEDRIENMRRIAEVAKLFSVAEVIPIVSFISPFKKERENCKNTIGEDQFIEVFISTSLHICEIRDPKGLYAKARAGTIPNFTGIDSPYEEPENPDLIISTETQTIEESTSIIFNYLIKQMND